MQKVCEKRGNPANGFRYCFKRCPISGACVVQNRNWLEDELLNWQIRNGQSITKADTEFNSSIFKIPYAQHIIMAESLTGKPF
jgi:hypothetical protein